MIRRLQVSNFRSLGRDVDVKLGRLTALVGRNGSGKSNFVDALQFLSDCMHLGLEGSITKRQGINAVRRFSAGHPYDVSFRVELDVPAVRPSKSSPSEETGLRNTGSRTSMASSG